MATKTIDTVTVDGRTIGYREQGSGPAVLLLHGWPTSSFLWREVMPPIAANNRVVAIDLPGFGVSDKPLDVRYGFTFFTRTIDGFLAALDIDTVALAGHDIGGPIALHWALHRPNRTTRLALLNTIVYPEFSDAVLEFVKACTTPEPRERLTSPAGLAEVMRTGLADPTRLTDEVLAAVREPFDSEESRIALANAGIGLEVDGFAELARRLPTLRPPMRLIYGEQDRILPDIATTAARLKHDLPHIEITALPDRGHFLQEEAGPEVGRMLARFFATENQRG
jgi:pimeloyl-ACP methyl ester carboxylesterase